jgi:hypothetical protein
MPARAARAEVVDFKPIDPKGLSQERFRAEVASGINAIHDCVHAGQRAQQEWNAEADRKRSAMAEDISEIRGAVHTLTELFSGNSKPAVKANLGWKDHAKLILTVIGAGSGFAFFYKFGAAILAAAHAFLMGAA